MATSGSSTSGRLNISTRSARWTLNNYSSEDVERLRKYAVNCRYMVFGYEIAPTTGTPHLQGYFSWDNKRSWDKVKGLISPSLSLRTCEASPQENRNYCVKAESKDPLKNPNYEEFGVCPIQGERTDWRVAVEQIQNGVDIEEVVENQPQLLPAIRSLQTFKSLTLKPKHRDVKVFILYGGAGTGKTRWAYDNYPDLYSKSRGEWWDGYSGQTAILLDDYYGYLSYSELLRVLDRYPYHAPVKGSYVWAQWETVIFTSNKHPSEWYRQGLTPALARRIHEIRLVE